MGWRVLVRQPEQRFGSFLHHEDHIWDAREYIKDVADGFPEDTLLYIASDGGEGGLRETYLVSSRGEAVKRPGKGWIRRGTPKSRWTELAEESAKEAEEAKYKNRATARLRRLVGDRDLLYSLDAYNSWRAKGEDLEKLVDELKSGEKFDWRFWDASPPNATLSLPAARRVMGRFREELKPVEPKFPFGEVPLHEADWKAFKEKDPDISNLSEVKYSVPLKRSPEYKAYEKELEDWRAEYSKIIEEEGED